MQTPSRGAPARGTRVIRFDPATRRVVARSAVVPGATALAFVDDRVFVAGVTWVSKNVEHTGPPMLFVLDPRTLQRTGEIALSGLGEQMSGGPQGLLWLALPYSLVRLDPSTGRVVAQVKIADEYSLALDASGDLLYDVVPGTKPEELLLQERDSQNGRRIADASIPMFPFFFLAATSDGVWAASGQPGSSGALFFYRTSPLRLVSASLTEGGGGVSEIGGTTGPALPSFSESPVADLSDGIVWVGSAGQLACFDATTGSLDAITEQLHQPIVTGPVVVTHNGAFSVASLYAPTPGTGLVRLFPPAACRT